MIDFSNPSMLVNRGVPIPIDTPAEYEAVMNAGQQIYSARPGGSFDSDALADAEHRILDGQPLETIISNMYDDANRRFPATQAADTISRDAQLDAGRQYSPTGAQVQQIITSAGISAQTAAAAAIPSRSLAEILNPGVRQLSTQTVRPMSAGPAQSIFGGFGGSAAPGGSGLNIGTILMFAAGGLVLFMLVKGKKARH